MGAEKFQEILDGSQNIFAGAKALLYLVIASAAFIVAYTLYGQISILPNISTSASIAMFLVFWIISFTVLYLGTNWIYEGAKLK